LNGSAIEQEIRDSGRDLHHRYNPYIDALEGLRQLLQERNELRFYTGLLNTPIIERENWIKDRLFPKEESDQNEEKMRNFLSFCSVLGDNLQ
jgi:hypothetical protein